MYVYTSLLCALENRLPSVGQNYFSIKILLLLNNCLSVLQKTLRLH